MGDSVDSSEVILYNVKDIQRIFGLGRTKAYQLIALDGFPIIRLNRQIYIPKKQLEKWIDRNCGRSFEF